MRQVAIVRAMPFFLGMSLFGWLVLTPPTAAEVPHRIDPQITPTPPPKEYFPFIARDYSFNLERVNRYRSQANLPALLDNPNWSYGASRHAYYMVKVNEATNYELTIYPEYSTEGSEAAANSNLLGSADVNFSTDQAIDYWMRSPFQALGILDPELQQSGFGAYREADGGNIQMAAVLDVRRGWVSGVPAGVTYPVRWPASGKTVNLRTYSGSDVPNPLSSPGCAGYQGLPILLQVGDGSNSVSFTTANPTLFRNGGSPLMHCVFHEASYVGGSSADTDLGRVLLDTRDAIVLIPKDPLTPGAIYTVAITATVNGTPTPYTWSFSVAADANP